MEKILTLNVPNELWVNNFSENKTATYTYSGPSTVWLVIESNGSISDSVFDAEPETTKTKIEVDIATANNATLAAVIGLKQNLDTDYEYTYTPETNHDGSVYQKIANPKVGDYYLFNYNTSQGVVLELIVKDPKISNWQIAQDRKAYVVKYDDAFDFETADQTKIDTYLAAINAYLTTIENAYPWKFITVNKSEVPKIPVSLTTLFSTLPDIT